MLVGVDTLPDFGKTWAAKIRLISTKIRIAGLQLQWKDQSFVHYDALWQLLRGRLSCSVPASRTLSGSEHSVLEFPSPEVDLNRLPWKNPMPTDSTIFVPQVEQEKLATALECLPWSQLSWSMHRGMQFLLVAYAKPIIDLHREVLACILETAINSKQDQLMLTLCGWKESFIKNHMGS